jgi:peptidoglycan/xylan/chitin deacetylase (PgdA/CDA1 family)
MGHSVKKILLPVILSMGGERWAARRTRGCGVIFMVHRVRGPKEESGWDGQELASLRKAFAFLRRSPDYYPVQVEELFGSEALDVRAGRIPVAITFDDGYHDQLEVAGPALAEFDIPATVFITSGFVDGELWMWWDQIRFALQNTERTDFPLAEFSGGGLHWNSDEHSRDRAASILTEALKRVPDDRRRSVMAALPEALDVEIPSRPPWNVAPTDWDTIRQWEALGLVKFAPHTRSHPILSRTDEGVARDEVEHSWRRLVEELAAPSPVLAFPNGTAEDFGPREMKIVEQAGLLGSVSTLPGLVRLRGESTAYAVLPRYVLPDELSRLRMIASGLESIRHRRIEGQGKPPYSRLPESERYS